MIKILFSVIALATACLAIDIPETPTWPSGRCTDKSLTIPSWIISRYKVVDGTTTFRVVNRAADPTGLIADIECKPDGSCHTTGIDEIRGTIEQSDDGPVITLHEIWVCGDTGDKVFFRSEGSTTITECAGDNCASPISYIVYGTLVLPVPLTPVQPSPPAGYLNPSCATVGDDQWTVTDISYKNYTRGQCKQWYYEDQLCFDNLTVTDQFISKGIYLNLTVENNAIEHEVVCGFAPSYGNHLPTTPLRCTGGDFNEITLDVTLSGAAPNFNLKIEELWYCLENPSRNTQPTLLLATGSTPVELECSTTTGITGKPDDIVTICTDPAASHRIDGTQEAKKTLPEFSLVTAFPINGGCTFDSVVNPTWYMRGLFFETKEFPADNPRSATLERFTCGLTGPGFADYFFYTGPTLSGNGIDSVINCNSYFNGQPVEKHWNCTYSFDPFEKVITLDKVWECRDKDPEHPLFFGGQGRFDWKKDPYYRCTTRETYQQCSWYDSLALLQPGIPYDIPYVTVSLENVPPPRIAAFRIDGQWTEAVDGEGAPEFS